jgi:hypothetical protein
MVIGLQIETPQHRCRSGYIPPPGLHLTIPPAVSGSDPARERPRHEITCDPHHRRDEGDTKAKRKLVNLI